jgi:hypothetical protein
VDQGLASVQRWPTSPVQEEDNDDWLTIDGQEFDKSLEDKLVSEQAKKLKDLATKVENFVEGEGDMEGARFEEQVFILSSLLSLLTNL